MALLRLLLRATPAISNAPLFLHMFSCFCHLVLTPTISVALIRARSRAESINSSPFKLGKATIFAVSVLGTFYLFSALFGYFWTTQELAVATLLDLSARAVAWIATALYLQGGFFPSLDRTYPVFLKAWWFLFLLISSVFLIMDLGIYRNHGTVQTRLWVLDSGSFAFGMFMVYVGFSGKRVVRLEAIKEKEDSGLSEPLLGSGDEESTPCKDGAFSDAGIFSRLTFSWMNPLLSLGYSKRVDFEDIPDLARADSIQGVYPKFRRKLESLMPENDTGDRQRGSGGSNIDTVRLAKALILTAWDHILLTALFALIYTLASYVGPYLISSLVQYLGGRRQSKNEGYVLVLAFAAAKFIECLTLRHCFFRLQQIGIRARAVLVATIYQKALVLSSSSRQRRSSGEIVNLMSIDAERVGEFSWYMHDLWMVPVQVALALLILYANLGLAAIATFIATIVVMLANYPIGRFQEKYEEKMMEAKDRRMKSTSEFLRNMKILKLQAWEMKFLSRIMELREKETYWLKKYLYTFASTILAFWGAPIVVSSATFSACLLLGIPLESGKVLSAVATFRVFQEPLYNLPDTVSMVIQTKVALDRISSFLCLEELNPDAVERLPCGTSGTAIEMKNASFSWDPSSGDGTLKDLNFQVLHGESVAICGTVGSGKSSLLSCILGEVSKLSGSVRIQGRIAYVPQSPWIQSGTIAENILFGKKMDAERYEKILEACSLKKDMEVLSFGDQTVIGERGINLSGGQKQRIQIARALYEDADIYLLDDPFSSVDAHTKTHLFKECLIGLLASKTVIYVTHQIEFLPSADLVLVMKQGRIVEMGNYNYVINSGTNFLELVDAHQKAFSTFGDLDNNPHTLSNIDKCYIGPDFMERQEEINNNKVSRCESISSHQQLIQEEEREKGRVGFSIYWKYITTSYKGALVFPILLAQIIFQCLQIGSNYWMAWAAPLSRESIPPVSSSILICIYIVLSAGSSIFVLIRASLVALVGYKTAIALFNKMHSCIFRAPMSFFDSTPTGRILSRASTDQNELDTNIAYKMGSVAVSIIQLLGIIAIMSQVAWQVFLIFIPVVAASIWYQNYYITTARELSRLVGIRKGLITQHFSESLSGSSIIRSSNQETRFMNANFYLSDAYTRPKLYNAAATEWLCFRLDMLSSIVFAFSVFLLVSLPNESIVPGIAGLAVTYGLNLNIIQAEVIWDLCKLENNIISVERILQYTCIASEPPLTIGASKLDTNWPSYGQIEIHDLQVRYALHMPIVLKGLNCIFPGGMKSGIVGRTGSGKSTMIQTLFRIVDPTFGKILIDGVNITSIGLHDLRSRLSIIPQEPTMFEGTVRTNLDPLGEHTDAQIWEALDKCQLGEEVRSKEEKLDSTVTENGENWSMGQRQLASLGRVLLKKNKILVLDEATASVDTASDNLIQKTLREQFSECTVITIAHRITSVLDSDVVCLLDNGMIAEFDSPSTLLANKSSLFAKLVSEYRASQSNIKGK